MAAAAPGIEIPHNTTLMVFFRLLVLGAVLFGLGFCWFMSTV